MDILKILDGPLDDIYPEDLDFFETELDTGGGYSEEYKAQCKSKIKKLRKRLLNGGVEETPQGSPDGGTYKTTAKLIVNIDDLAPKGADPVADSLTAEQKIFRDIENIRGESSYKTNFKRYVADKSDINAAFVDKYHSFFRPEEIDAIISTKQMGEEFIEKYFAALDQKKIARYQKFSEEFFMKHFSQLDYNIVLKSGKNEWRKKEKRSRQLDIFLRLKGVKI